MKEYKPYKEGKVRELYDLGDSLVMVCTDRISAFDKILDTDIPEKGAILNCMSYRYSGKGRNSELHVQILV